MGLRKVLLLVAVVGCYSALAGAIHEDLWLPRGFCSSTNSCPENECCAMHPLRSSKPQCYRIRNLGETCVPQSGLNHLTPAHPDGSEKVNHVYRIICPCASHLTCDWETGICVKH